MKEGRGEEAKTDSNSMSLTPTRLYLNFRLTLSVNNGLGRWDCPAACRRQDSGADEFVTFWHRFLTKCAGSLNRPCLCPKLEPLIERPAKVSSHFVQARLNQHFCVELGCSLPPLNFVWH